LNRSWKSFSEQRSRTLASTDIDFKIHGLEEARNTFLREDEERWRLKSRMLWLAGGDKNTRFFHRVASSRRSKKQLWDIEDEDDTLHHSQEDIKAAASTILKFFSRMPLLLA
jgi:hypothetical protein